MYRKKNYLIITAIFILTFLAGNLVYPQFLNIYRFPNIPFKFGLDLQGGVHLVYQANLAEIEPEERPKTSPAGKNF